MIEPNSYVNLYRSKVKANTLPQFAIEIGYLHNAMGIVLKEFIEMVNKQTSQNYKSQPAPSFPQIYPGRKDDQNINQMNRPQFLKLQNTKDSKIEELSDEEIDQKGKLRSKEVEERIEQMRTQRPVEKINLNTYLTIPFSEPAPLQFPATQQVKKPIYRQGKKHNKSTEKLEGVECQMCQRFYESFEGKSKNNKLCKHMSKHQTSAPYAKIKSFSQQFDDL